MDNLLPVIRNAARALIIDQGRILLLRKEDEQGERFALPGGAQDPGEPLAEALDRECREEIGTSVTVHDLLYVADWFKPRNSDPPTRKHLVEFLFLCSVPEGYTPVNGYHPDKHQVEVVWKELSALPEITLFPRSLAGWLQQTEKPGRKVYLGLID